jgi:hypothetical protein
MKLSLYEIEQSQLQLIEQLIDNGGELTEELETALTLNQENLTTKGTNYGFIIKQLTGECAIIDGEIARLNALKKSRVKSVERLENALSVAMHVFQVEEIKSPVMKINFRKSESVEIDNIALIPATYLVTKETVTPDKTAIKAALKAGAEIQGAHIQVNQNIQIK